MSALTLASNCNAFWTDKSVNVDDWCEYGLKLASLAYQMRVIFTGNLAQFPLSCDHFQTALSSQSADCVMNEETRGTSTDGNPVSRL